MSDLELLKPGYDPVLTMQDFDGTPAAKAINCHNGMRSKCEQHGWCWMSFLEYGIKASELLKVNDAQVTRIVRIILDGKQEEK